MSEARRLLLERGYNNTAMDESYVSHVTSEWHEMLEGINDEHQRGVMAVLFQNEMNYINSLNEETLSTGVGSFTKYLFPILRRVFPNLIANQIVSVQPMNAPVGGIFTYEYKYGDTKGSVTSGQNLIETFQEWYSSEFIDLENKVADVGAGPNLKWDSVTNPTDRIPFRFLPVHAKDTSKDYVVSLTYICNGGANTVTIEDNGSGTLLVAAAAAFPGNVGASVGTINYTTGAWTLDLSALNAANQPDANVAITSSYFYDSERVSSTTAPGAGINSSNFDTSLGQVSKIPEINMDITLTTVTAISRKLKARWSAEAMDDLRAFHGLNAETELVAGISNEIALELDREIIDDLVTGARFSASYSLTAGPGIPAVASGGSFSELDSIRGLLSIIEAMSASIHTASLRAQANFIVTSPQIGALLAQLTTHGDFMMVNRVNDNVQAASYGPLTSNFGIRQLGTLLGKYMVYQDPFLASNKMLVGLKGRSFLDAGYVYAPYIPLQMTQTFLDPDDITYRKGFRTRYAKKMLRSEYYGVITVSGLPTIVG